MNNKILLSVAAAATLAMTFTGCGSSSTASTEDVSGSAVKAELNGATVSFGGATATTTSTGAFTVTGTAGSTAIEVSEGNYTLNNITKVNGMVLKATKAQVDAGAPTSMLTTLIEEFGDIETAFNALGLDYDAATTDLSTVDAGDFENAAVAIAILMEKTSNLGSAMSFLKSQSTNKLTLATLETAINATVDADTGISDADKALVKAVSASVKAGEALGHALNMVNENNATLTYDVSAYQMTDVIDTNATDTDASDDIISFDMTNSAADLTNANGNTSLYLSIKGTDVANLNTSFFMGLSNLDIATSGDDITLNNANATAIMNTVANSNMSYALTLDTNASALDASSIFSGNDLNVTAFTNYVESMYAADGSATLGSFDMANGNYSVKVYVDVNGVKITKDNRLTDIVSSSMSITDSEDETLFSDERAYKVIDTNLEK